ncbi:hypothetical protein HC031_11235 [Planosporangium thailandense]|uniref:Cytoplasmic protein n=1 Tax=Planosporangium thailandense TaxID=765197 RepID=A0ABX0XYP2_9ACTN|nr:hypothetical protein [Planosporangium thailandense]NJC70279.1 hypothetical protein [Planosporangium thailandense]
MDKEQPPYERPLSRELPEPPGGPVEVPELRVDEPPRRDSPDEDVSEEAGLPEPPD